jgi:hypothetical protein
VYVKCLLVTPVAMMEHPRIRDGFRRSQRLVKRAFLTSLGAAGIMFLIPTVMASVLSFMMQVTAKAYDPDKPEKPAVVQTADEPENADARIKPPSDSAGVNWSFSRTPRIPENKDEPMDMRAKVKHTVLETAMQIFWLPLQVLVLSFSGIIVALLYIKTRLAGGESMHDLVERFEDDERPKKKWQERVRARLIQSGRVPSKP